MLQFLPPIPSPNSCRVNVDKFFYLSSYLDIYSFVYTQMGLPKNPPAMQETPVRFLGQEDSPGEGIGYPFQYSWASLVAQMVKNPPARWETWIRSLVWEDPLGEGLATHSSIVAWRIPMDRGAWRTIVHGVAKSQK